MKKKAVSVLLAISMLAAGMMGCGKQAATDSTGAAAETPAAQASESKEAADTGASSGAVEIEFVNQKREAADTFQAVIDKFSEQNPDIKVTLNTTPDGSGVLMTRASSDTLPDILMHWPTDAQFVQFANEGLLADLSGKDYTGNIVLSCSIPEVFENLQSGQPVLIDDGKIRAVVESLTEKGAYLKITYTKPKGGKIKNQKSLNFPQTPMNLSPLTEKDKEDLGFVVQHADAIGYSFVKSAADVALLQKELKKRCGKSFHHLALVAKIENKEAVDHLPDIIIQAASRQPLGIMIARGDLAVEVGYRRLAEVQEEIMWVCEAAHIPVIWATQVLENLVKTGLPSRAEITDAAMGERAECVMLNKGPYIVEAVTVLTNILQRMEQHQYKKTSQLRALHIAEHVFEEL